MIKLIYLNQIYLLISISIISLIIQSFPTNNLNTHPLILILILFLITITSSFNIRIFFNNHWFSFLVFLIIIGGIIIIFIYFIRFINNIKTSIKLNFLKSYPIKIFLLIFITLIIFKNINRNLFVIRFNEINSIFTNFNLNSISYLTLIYLYPKNSSTLISIIYLLISLTIIVKICLIKKLTLRKIN